MSQYTATPPRPSTSAPGDGSRTITITQDPTQEEGDDSQGGSGLNEGDIVGTVRLRAGPARRNRPRVAWDEGVIDNEGCGKKKSKICCIFHKARRFDESSSEESDSDSDVDSCDGHDHDTDQHSGGDGASSSQQRPTSGPSKVHELSDDDEPNAYERMPGSKKKGKRKAAA